MTPAERDTLVCNELVMLATRTAKLIDYYGPGRAAAPTLLDWCSTHIRIGLIREKYRAEHDPEPRVVFNGLDLSDLVASPQHCNGDAGPSDEPGDDSDR